MQRTIALALLLAAASASFDSTLHLTSRGGRGCAAFVTPPLARAAAPARAAPATLAAARGGAYVPDGLTAEQWAAQRQRDSAKGEYGGGQGLGKLGISKFEWRTMKSWQESGQKHQFAAQLTGGKSQPYMRANYKRPAVASQFARAERDFAEGQNAAAGGTWLEGFLNDGIKQDAPKPAKRGLFGRGR